MNDPADNTISSISSKQNSPEKICEVNRFQENCPKSINMMEIASNLQYLKYQNLEKDFEIEILKQSLKDFKSLTNNTANLSNPKVHILYQYNKYDIIKEVIKLEQIVYHQDNHLMHITNLKDIPENPAA